MNTLQIIEEMNANPALAEDLRTVVLSRELLAIPASISSIDERLDKLVQISEKHETRLDSIDERLVRLAEISEKHETRLDSIDERLVRLAEISEKHE
ncbi:MAG: hypothetical protein HKL80_01595, partial [Acidimicrobiales bacterium]|nr:hypothetical protein [Acidimicrobiales bacterium]